MTSEAEFLKKLYSSAFRFVKQRLRTFKPVELALYSKTLTKFAERLAETPDTIKSKKDFLQSLQKELRNAQAYPNTKPLMFLRRVSDVHLTPFGSTVMGTGARHGDLDISFSGVYHIRHTNREVTLNTSTKKALQGCLLADLRRFLRERDRLQHATPAVVLARARIPILKFKERKRGLSCDLSIGNDSGVIRSQILNEIMKADPRVRMLVLLFKKWLRLRKLNNPSTGSFGSYALTVMILAVCVERSILPSLQKLIPSLEDTKLTDLHQHCHKIARALENRKGIAPNQESLLELFLASFAFLSMYITREAMHDGQAPHIAVCCRNGMVVDSIERSARGGGVMIRDPFDPESNCGKTVSRKSLGEASNIIQRHLAEVSSFLMCPEEERRSKWQAIFYTLFRMNLKFKKMTRMTPVMIGMKKAPLRHSALLTDYDRLIARYFENGMHRRASKVDKDAFAPWFLRRFEAQWMQHKDKGEEIVDESSTDEEEEEEEEFNQSLFNIKDTPVAGAAA